MLWKCCTQYASTFGKLSSGHRTGKGQFFTPGPKKGNAKECSNYCTIAFILHTSKVMLKILQARLQQYLNHELPDVQAGFRKGRGTRDQTANIHWVIKKKQESSRKTSTFALLTTPKPLTVWITTNWKILQEIPTTWPVSWEICMYAGQEATVRIGHRTTDWFQIRKGVFQSSIFSFYLFNLYAEYIMRNAGLDETSSLRACWCENVLTCLTLR